MKGIILAGGNGSRLWPLTQSISKQLLPVYDKPMIYYPLTTLILTGVREMLIITTPGHLAKFKELLGTGEDLGLKLEYLAQVSPKGIADAFLIAPRRFQQDSVVLILGDNFLYGMGLGSSLSSVFSGSGALAFGYPVASPNDYGVVVLDKAGNPKKIYEKPKKFISNLAIPGLYFFDKSVFLHVKNLKPSNRGELEITDLLKIYLNEGSLKIKVLERGTAWLDTGTHQNLIAAGEFVKVIEDRQGLKIGCPEEVAFREGLISLKKFKEIINKTPVGDYKNYLVSLLTEFGS